MTPEEYYKEVVKLDMDKFDKKAAKFDYYDLIEFADSYRKKQLSIHGVVVPKDTLSNLDEAIKKAKHNMDKIKDVDKHLDDIR
jgi:hypothetical protein